MEGISLTVPIFTSKETCRTWRGFSTLALSLSLSLSLYLHGYILLENKHTYPQSPPSISSTSSIRVSWIQRFHTPPIILKIKNFFNNNSGLASHSHTLWTLATNREPLLSWFIPTRPFQPIPKREKIKREREREKHTHMSICAFWSILNLQKRESVHLKPLQNQKKKKKF